MYPQRMLPARAFSDPVGSHTPEERYRRASHPSPTRPAGYFLLGFALLLSGCVSLSSQPIPTTSPFPATSTPTFLFPTLIPTATLTPAPSPSAASDPLTSLGEVIFEDEFDLDRGWQIQIFGSGGAGLLDGAYSLSARQPFTRVVGYSPAGMSANGYLEVTALPILCSSDDEYGLVFRTNPRGEYYRYTLNCIGEARLSRISTEGEFVILSDIRPDSVFPGLLIGNRLAVRMEGEDFKLFVNGSEIAHARDAVLGSGGFGVFIRTRQGGQTTVQFDEFILWSLRSSSTVLGTSTPE